MSIRERHVRQKRLTKQQRAKRLTQVIFYGAPDIFISAAVDSDGTAYLYTAPSKELTAVTDIEDDEGVWVVSKPNYSWIVVGEYDASYWQTSAIDRVKQSEVLDKFECIHCGEVYVRHQLRTTFCDNCDRVLEIRKVEANHE